MITCRRLSQGLAVLLTAAVPAFAEPPPNPKIDRGLQESLRHGGATQRVIISVKPGYRAEIRQSLEKHGDRIKSEHPFVDALAADIHSDDVNELANHPWVLAVSIDATVYAGGAADSYGNFNGWQGNVSAGVMPGGALDTKPANTLRETLGLPRASNSLTPSGSGVGVAIIDSGIAPLDDFAGRRFDGEAVCLPRPQVDPVGVPERACLRTERRCQVVDLGIGRGRAAIVLHHEAVHDSAGAAPAECSR